MGRRILIVNPRSARVTVDVVQRLAEAFPDHEQVDFPTHAPAIERLDGPGRVLVCGGDSTMSAIAGLLTGTSHVMGVIPGGIYNNFARALGVPVDLEQAIEVVRHGSPRPCAVGEANGHTFVEVALVGDLGAAIELGEATRRFELGEAVKRAAALATMAPFRYRVTGDVRLRGRASAIVIANTPTTGALLEVSGKGPAQPWLELRVSARRGRWDLLRGLLRRRPVGDAPFRVRDILLACDPPMPVIADGVELGPTPLRARILPGAVTVILPESGPPRPTIGSTRCGSE
jgi:diacylglycerol kinase family enzyme